ncbi:MAG: hypothetical protein GXO49_02455, partial [Chlorobi bacterium]|nr:hypothetical protein [Chlorobiota bacterium]
MAVYVGRWDCTSCGNIGNLGPNLHCEKCGSPRPENVKFYMASDQEVLDKKKIAQAKAGSDWVCAFCNSQNHATQNTCNSCGASKNDSEKKLKEKDYNINDIPTNSQKTPTYSPPKKSLKKSKLKIGCLYLPALIVSLSIIFLILTFAFTTPIKVEVVGTHWERKIEIERYLLLTENGWSIPPGGQLISQHKAIHHYNQIQTGTVTKTRNIHVKVGTETYVCGKRDLGNGYFEDRYCTRDIYETRTETYEEPVYKQIPVYKTEYTYKIWRWKKANPLKEKGNDFKPKWPVISGNKIRAIDSIEKYSI